MPSALLKTDSRPLQVLTGRVGFTASTDVNSVVAGYGFTAAKVTDVFGSCVITPKEGVPEIGTIVSATATLACTGAAATAAKACTVVWHPTTDGTVRFQVMVVTDEAAEATTAPANVGVPAAAIGADVDLCFTVYYLAK